MWLLYYCGEEQRFPGGVLHRRRSPDLCLVSLKVNHLATAESLYSSHDRLGESCFLLGGLTCGPDRYEPKAVDGREINMKDLLKTFCFSTVFREDTNHDETFGPDFSWD